MLLIRTGSTLYLQCNLLSLFATALRYTALQGNFTSPRYPKNYPNNALQNYIIKINQDGLIDINFEVFALESSSTCSYDYVKFYHVIGSSRTLAATYCGEGPKKCNSATNEVLVQFKSDGSSTRKGFFATYKF